METKKTNKANLEIRKNLFFQTGLMIALILVFAAFQWKTYEKKSFILTDPEIIDVDLIPITEPEKQKPEPPKPQLTEFKINEKVQEQGEIKFEDIEDYKGNTYNYKKPELFEEPEHFGDGEIFKIVQEMPEFPGGDEERNKFLEKNLKYPQIAIQTEISGTVHVSFIVEPDGSLSNITILKGIGGGCDEEAVRVIKKMPKWKPGKQRNIPVRVNFILPIKFSLKSQ